MNKTNIMRSVKGAVASIHGSFSHYAESLPETTGVIDHALRGSGLGEKSLRLRKRLVKEAIRCTQLNSKGLKKELKNG